jgi:hypothetical protein
MSGDSRSIEEVWCVIDEFPDYEVSSTGLVMNSDTNRIMRISRTAQGALKVGLMGDDGRQHTRSLKVLVADAFVGGRDEIYNTPIHLDGDSENCNADNLIWRPRWFAHRYTYQFNHIYAYSTTNQVRDVSTGVVYDNIYTAARRHGLLMNDILMSCSNGQKCRPTNQIFEFIISPR